MFTFEKCLIVDVETTGLDPETDKVIEIGAVLYSTTHQTTLAQMSMLLPAENNPCEAINRIPAGALPKPHEEPVVDWRGLLFAADCIVAHNAEFDRSFLVKVDVEFGERPWVCTCFDFQWPQASRESQGLVPLALDHGVGVSRAHRALDDCQLIAALFDRMVDLPEMFTRALRPKAMFAAVVSYDDRQLAKDAGFKWNGDTKLWTRSMAIEDAENLPFQTRQLHPQT